MNPSLVKVGYQERCVLRNSLEHEVTVTGVTGTQRLNIHTEASHPAAFIKVYRTEEDQQEDYIDISISRRDWRSVHLGYGRRVVFIIQVG